MDSRNEKQLELFRQEVLRDMNYGGPNAPVHYTRTLEVIDQLLDTREEVRQLELVLGDEADKISDLDDVIAELRAEVADLVQENDLLRGGDYVEGPEEL